MKSRLHWIVALGVVLVGLTLSTVFLTWEGTASVLFGWIAFLYQTSKRVTVDWPAVVVGGVALVLFVVGLHAFARRLLRPSGVAWKLRWSLTCATLVVLVFAAGVAIIGLIHQVGWLATAREPTFVASIQATGDYSYSSKLNLRQVGLAVHPLPAGGTFAEDGTMRHSWETALIQTGMAIYSINIDKDKPWNDPANQETFRRVCPLFINPELRGAPYKDGEGYGLSHYAANSRVMAGNYAASETELEGHTSTTLAIGEVNAHFKPWGHPVNWRDPAQGINRSPDGFGGRSGAGGANFLMADGSVRFLSERTSPEVLRALSSPNGQDKADTENLDAVLEGRKP